MYLQNKRLQLKKLGWANEKKIKKSENGNQAQEFCRLKVVSTLSVSLRKKKTCPTYTVQKYERLISITWKAGHWDPTNAQRHQDADFCFLQQIKIYPICYEQP